MLKSVANMMRRKANKGVNPHGKVSRLNSSDIKVNDNIIDVANENVIIAGAPVHERSLFRVNKHKPYEAKREVSDDIIYAGPSKSLIPLPKGDIVPVSNPPKINASNKKVPPVQQEQVGTNAANSYERYAFARSESASKGENYMRERLTKEQIGHLNASSDPLARAASAKKLGIEGGADMAEDAYRDKVHSYFKNQIKQGPTTMDHVWGHKVPQYATGTAVIAGTASIISDLANTKGSQSNAQLYGQAPGPGM